MADPAKFKSESEVIYGEEAGWHILKKLDITTEESKSISYPITMFTLLCACVERCLATLHPEGFTYDVNPTIASEEYSEFNPYYGNIEEYVTNLLSIYRTNVLLDAIDGKIKLLCANGKYCWPSSIYPYYIENTDHISLLSRAQVRRIGENVISSSHITSGGYEVNPRYLKMTAEDKCYYEAIAERAKIMKLFTHRFCYFADWDRTGQYRIDGMHIFGYYGYNGIPLKWWFQHTQSEIWNASQGGWAQMDGLPLTISFEPSLPPSDVNGFIGWNSWAQLKSFYAVGAGGYNDGLYLRASYKWNQFAVDLGYRHINKKLKIYAYAEAGYDFAIGGIFTSNSLPGTGRLVHGRNLLWNVEQSGTAYVWTHLENGASDLSRQSVPPLPPAVMFYRDIPMLNPPIAAGDTYWGTHTAFENHGYLIQPMQYWYFNYFRGSDSDVS